MLYKSKFRCIITILALFLGFLPIIGIKSVRAQGDPVPNGATCYIAGPIKETVPQENDLKQKLNNLEKIYKQKKISKNTYLIRKKELLKQLENTKTKTNNK